MDILIILINLNTNGNGHVKNFRRNESNAHEL